MFSYRHAFHAGNHADVLKHVVLLALVRHLHRKEGGCWLVDTHAGAGWYELSDAAARKNREFEGGIGAFADDEPRSAADVSSKETFAEVRAWKKAQKAAKRSKAEFSAKS